jgi:hypothetical protein
MKKIPQIPFGQGLKKKGPIIEIPKDMTPKPIKRGKLDKPYPMPIAGDDMAFPNPGMPKYTSIKKSKHVNRTYNTY